MLLTWRWGAGSRTSTVGDFQVKFATSHSMQRQLTVFDQGGKMEVGTYRLSPISPSDREPRKGGKHTGTRPHKHTTRRIGPAVVRRRLA